MSHEASDNLRQDVYAESLELEKTLTLSPDDQRLLEIARKQYGKFPGLLEKLVDRLKKESSPKPAE